MFELFPGNYRWSYNALLTLAAGGQIGDIDLILGRLRAQTNEDETWFREWSSLGAVLERRADANLAGGAKESASENLFLASLYHTIGEHFVPPADPRRLESYGHVLAAFERARSLARHKIERVSVPYEATTLPAYFVPSLSGAARAPAVIFVCGLDTTKELSYLRVRRHLAERGLHCLAIDTPGIGEALRYQKLYTRFDYERPVAAAIDYLAGRADVDASRIGIIGSSLGGYYIARAAAFEPRIKAAVAWGAIYDYHAVWQRRMSGGGTVAAPRFQLMFITGTETMEAAIAHISEFKVAPFGPRIRCPFLILHGAEDLQVAAADASAMFDAIGSPDKEIKIFTGEDAGAAHCQFDNHLPALQYAADWLAGKLGAS